MATLNPKQAPRDILQYNEINKGHIIEKEIVHNERMIYIYTTQRDSAFSIQKSNSCSKRATKMLVLFTQGDDHIILKTNSNAIKESIYH